MRLIRFVILGVAVIAAIAVVVAAGRHDQAVARHATAPAAAPARVTLPASPGTYLGVYRSGAPASFAGVTGFTGHTGVRPDVVLYFSGWGEPFQASFAGTTAKAGAVPLVQLEPGTVPLAAIASGRYDGYLSSYAGAVRAYRHPVILSFGHEMNGWWYPWGYRHTSPRVFVAAWRHIVRLFGAAGAHNVTWLWTVNVIHDAQHGRIPRPDPWWPGRSYVTWVGIDGYYFSSAATFAPLFGPTIAAVRELTGGPILIAETGASAGQPAKITDLFRGVQTYGLLGLVWFDARGSRDWRLTSPAAIAAFRQGAQAYPAQVP